MKAIVRIAVLLVLSVSGSAIAGAPPPEAAVEAAPVLIETAPTVEVAPAVEAAAVITPTAEIAPTPVVTPAALPSPTTINATYDVSKAGIRVGVVEERYQRTGDTYTLVSTTRAVGVFSWFQSGKIIVNSSGLIDEKGLRPLMFNGNNENKKDDHKHGEFDWGAKQISVTRGTQPSTLELPDNTQDRLSAMYQFMFLPLQPETTVPFPMLNGHYLTDLNFEVSDGGTIKVPAGEYATLYLDNQIQKKDERTELWLATEFYNIPVKMVITDDGGGKLTQALRKLEVGP